MYDDLLGKKNKKQRGVVVVQEIEWDDEKKELTTTAEEAFEVELDEDGNINKVGDIEIEPSQDIASQCPYNILDGIDGDECANCQIDCMYAFI